MPSGHGWMPGADTSRPLAGFATALARCRGLVDHVAVSESSFPSYSSGLGAHFYVRKRPGWRLGDPFTAAGIAQQINATVKGGHAYQGNADLIGVETQGGLYNANGEPWDAYQLVALGYVAWWCRELWGGSFPLRLMGRSDDTGIGYHRLGCEGNFPALPDLRAGYSQRPGSWQLWSKAPGKICPGDAKVLQMPQVLAYAQAWAATNGTSYMEDDMFEESDRAVLAAAEAAAQEAARAANAAAAAAGRAADAAVAAATVAQQAVVQASAGRGDTRAGASAVLAAVADAAARAPRVNGARYDRITASSYAELAARAEAEGLDYLQLSGQLVGVTSAPLSPVQVQLVADAAREGAEAAAATGGSFTLTRPT